MKPEGKPEDGHRSSWQWWLGALLILVAFTFGAIGLREYENAPEHGGHADLLSILYHTLQLFILHAPHLEPPIPWQLHVGRLLAAGLFLAAAGKAFVKVFREELRGLRLWLPWREGHIVVCGLGDLGLRLVLDGRQRRKFVVAIEKGAGRGALESARKSGALVLEGDARDLSQLRQARIERAEFIVAACRNDQTNIAIAALAGQLAAARNRPSEPLICRLLIRDAKLRSLVSDEAVFPRAGPSYRVNFRDLDPEATAARQAFRRYPLDFRPIRENDPITVHLVVIGFGPIGQALALQAARIGHFANEVAKERRKLRITVLDKDQTGWNDFVLRHAKLKDVCDARFEHYGPGEAGLLPATSALCLAGDALVTYAVAIETDKQTSLRVALELSKTITESPVQILVYQQSRVGLASLLRQRGPGSPQLTRIHAFGMTEDVFTWDVLLHESEDRLARAIHENYRRERAKEHVPDKDNPGWEDLSEDFRESNRQAADHIAVKLRAVGYHDEPLTKEKQAIIDFEEQETLLLAKMEHVRWCAERWLDGWEFGPVRDPAKRISDSLVQWDKLPIDRQKRDIEQVAAIPAVLSEAGLGVHR